MSTRIASLGKGRTQRWGNGPGFESIGAHTGHQELPFAEQRCIFFAPDLLHEAQTGAVQFKHLRGNPQFIVQSRWRVIARLAGVDHEQQVVLRQCRLGKTQCA
ncbi:hypothetical protein D3C71_1741070 [compost metagenome]